MWYEQPCLLYRLMDIAKEMIRESLPIKCLEAVILGMYPSHWAFRLGVHSYVAMVSLKWSQAQLIYTAFLLFNPPPPFLKESQAYNTTELFPTHVGECTGTA